MSDSFAKEQLKAFVSRIERLEEEKSSIADDIKDVYGEAKAVGFDTKTLRAVIRLRKQDAQERREQADLLDVYLNALDMLPLFVPRDPDGRGASTNDQNERPVPCGDGWRQ